jgi:hypothetical protein
MSFHQPLLGPTGAHWLDDLSDVSCKDSTRQHAADDPLLSCNPLPLLGSRSQRGISPGVTTTGAAKGCALSGA